MKKAWRRINAYGMAKGGEMTACEICAAKSGRRKKRRGEGREIKRNGATQRIITWRSAAHLAPRKAAAAAPVNCAQAKTHSTHLALSRLLHNARTRCAYCISRLIKHTLRTAQSSNGSKAETGRQRQSGNIARVALARSMARMLLENSGLASGVAASPGMRARQHQHLAASTGARRTPRAPPAAQTRCAP